MVRTIVIFAAILLWGNLGYSQNTSTSDFPKYIDTGNNEKDTDDYATRKQAWIEQNSKMYEAMTKADETSSTAAAASIEPVVETSKDELVLDTKQPHLFVSQRHEVGKGADIDASEKLLMELKSFTFYVDLPQKLLYRKSNESSSVMIFSMSNALKQIYCQDCDNVSIVIVQQSDTEIVVEVKEHADDDFSVLIFFKKNNL